ncbi:hypothetical protein AA0114_g8144 [Alternaria tenuissima]|uniref:Uncharacterized protein n=1 Tax=Alternaria tenuissima TaxID=119927 RepID=A0A4Q4MD52_9PLEO|nr:hypothetical protein AA0114_g8144 [Alternaria tenuissima]
MFTKLAVSFLAMQMLASATPNQQRRANDVDITSLDKNVTSTSGVGNVAAAAGVSYGGGLTAGSSDFGLGGGFNITPEVLTVGAGLGLNSANVSANIQFTGAKNGSVELVFESSAPIVCTPGFKDGKSTVSCTTV